MFFNSRTQLCSNYKSRNKKKGETFYVFKHETKLNETQALMK